MHDMKSVDCSTHLLNYSRVKVHFEILFVFFDITRTSKVFPRVMDKDIAKPDCLDQIRTDRHWNFVGLCSKGFSYVTGEGGNHTAVSSAKYSH